MLINATATEAKAILGAMANIAATNGDEHVTAADRACLVAAHHYLLRQRGRLDPDTLSRPSATELAIALPDRMLAIDAARMLTVMAFVDGRLDPAKNRCGTRLCRRPWHRRTLHSGNYRGGSRRAAARAGGYGPVQS